MYKASIKLLLTLCLLLLAAPAWAALVRDAVSQNQKTVTGTTLDLTHTATGTTTDGLLVVLCAVNTSGATVISGINWDQAGTPTALTQHVTFDPTVSTRLDIWYLKLPSTGTKTIRVTTSIAQLTACHAITYTGVNQTTPLGTAVTHDVTPAATASTVDVTSAVGNFVIGVAGWTVAPTTETPGAGQTEIGTGNEQSGLEERVSEEAGAATTTHSWTWVTAMNSALIGVSVNAAAATGRSRAPILFQ